MTFLKKKNSVVILVVDCTDFNLFRVIIIVLSHSIQIILFTLYLCFNTNKWMLSSKMNRSYPVNQSTAS